MNNFNSHDTIITQNDDFVNSISNFTMEDLKKSPVWINWKLIPDKKDPTKLNKVPINSATGKAAEVDNQQTWNSYTSAEKEVQKYDGIGFIFTDDICGIDIDNKKDNPNIVKQAETIINLMDTYTESSPSGKGYHIIFKCDISKIPTATVNNILQLDPEYYYKNPYNELECYPAGLTKRYFTYTGKTINDKNIEERTEQFLIFLDNYMLRSNFNKKNVRQEQSKASKADNLTKDILEIARNAKNGAEFISLYDRGDISAYNSDDSAADMALCIRLAFWLQGDFNEIDRYFRKSALYRDKWERSDYRTNTINKAISKCNGKYYTPKQPPGRPKTKKENKYKIDAPEDLISETTSKYGIIDAEKITIAGVALQLKQIGVTAKYNEITRKDEFHGNIADFKSEHIKNDFPIEIYNVLNLYYPKCPKKDVFDFMKRISNKNAYNPVMELIKSGKWDGKDRRPEVHYILRIKPDDKLSKTLIYKWGWQNISMARNDSGKYGADGVLVLQGGQGIGKTTFARWVALRDEWFADGLHLNFSDKDTTRRATSVWIGELGEISRTFKSDIDALKAFITTPQDIYRLPYGHADEELSRRTSFIGTCNDEKYLIDETGNRRFWTIPVEEIDLDALKNFDALQFYLQIYEQDAKNNIQGFRLTKDEQRLLAERNGQFEKPLKAELEIRDILSEVKPNDLLEEMTASKFKDLYPILRNYDVSQIGRALNKINVEQRKDGKGSRLYMLPAPLKGNWNN